MYKAALFLNILLLFRRQARFASIGTQKKMFQPEQNTLRLEREKILHRLCFLITHEHYGNEALAELEKTPLEQLIDHSFGSIFPNMDAKWLRVYERTALYGETLEITDYSPEIDTELKIVCFPTFPGHCGCMLFDRRRIQTVQSSTSEDNRAKP